MMYKLISVLLVDDVFGFMWSPLWHLDNYTVGFQIQNNLFFLFWFHFEINDLRVSEAPYHFENEWDEALNQLPVI
jgi:hypothetical protein